MPTVAEVLNHGLDLHRSGELDRAEAIYRRVLAFDAHQPDALNLLGEVARARGNLDEGVRLFRAAIAIDDARPAFHVGLANALMEQGSSDAALDRYRRAVALDPAQADALASLGSVAARLEDHAVSVSLLERAVQLAPMRADLLIGLGRELRFAGRPLEAISVLERALACGAEPTATLELLALSHRIRFDFEAAVSIYRRALDLAPDDINLSVQLATVLVDQGKPAAAIDRIRAAIASEPSWATSFCLLARALRGVGDGRGAIAALQRALALDPGQADAHSDLGMLLQDQADLTGALGHLEVACGLNPDQPAAMSNLGNLMHMAGQFERALHCHDRVVAQRPEFAHVHLNRAVALHSLGRVGEAMQAYIRALALAPDSPGAYNNLAGELQALGRYVEAGRNYRLALLLRPDFAAAHSNLLFCLNYDETIDAQALFAEYRRWEDLHARPHYPSIRPHGNERNPERRLRVGYLSADFFHHPIATNTVGLIEHHDRSQVEVVCYAEVHRPDRMTRRFQARADHWRSTVGMSDGEVAELIRSDSIDILVSMAGHTAGNRLPVCARKPAPILVSYGDLSTTGLDVMDYWLTDAVIHPEDTTELFTEELVRLPLLVLHEPPAEAPAVAPLPALRTGRISFGSFNNPAKLTPGVIALWSRLLHAVPESRLVLGYMNLLDDGLQKQRLVESFAAHGIAAGRIDTLGLIFDRGEHLARMAEIDIAVDPFPFNGCTATFEALWMGIPVVTLAGQRWLGRMGMSFLTEAGLADWVATSHDDYVAKVVQLAGDLDRLARIRAGLRDRVAASLLCDAPAYARSVERAYRTMWRRWCNADD